MTGRGLPAAGYALAALALLAACGEGAPAAVRVAGGDAERGRAVLAANAYGCIGCHAVPGVAAATGTVGPPLHAMARRGYVAGRLSNRPDNLIAWIQHPSRIDPQSAMPDTGITRAEATDVAAYLYTLTELPR